jgi:hypothetical protein
MSINRENCLIFYKGFYFKNAKKNLKITIHKIILNPGLISIKSTNLIHNIKIRVEISANQVSEI